MYLIAFGVMDSETNRTGSDLCKGLGRPSNLHLV
jgi:hypothetical protein